MKKIIYLSITVLLLTATFAIAGDYGYRHERNNTPSYGSDYDYKSGNNYTWRKDGSGRTHVRGNNIYTGSQWNTTIEKVARCMEWIQI